MSRSQIHADGDFPHGLSCTVCNKEIPPGGIYVEKFESFLAQDVTLLTIACEDCDGKVKE